MISVLVPCCCVLSVLVVDLCWFGGSRTLHEIGLSQLGTGPHILWVCERAKKNYTRALMDGVCVSRNRLQPAMKGSSFLDAVTVRNPDSLGIVLLNDKSSTSKARVNNM